MPRDVALAKISDDSPGMFISTKTAPIAIPRTAPIGIILAMMLAGSNSLVALEYRYIPVPRATRTAENPIARLSKSSAGIFDKIRSAAVVPAINMPIIPTDCIDIPLAFFVAKNIDAPIATITAERIDADLRSLSKSISASKYKDNAVAATIAAILTIDLESAADLLARRDAKASAVIIVTIAEAPLIRTPQGIIPITPSDGISTAITAAIPSIVPAEPILPLAIRDAAASSTMIIPILTAPFTNDDLLILPSNIIAGTSKSIARAMPANDIVPPETDFENLEASTNMPIRIPTHSAPLVNVFLFIMEKIFIAPASKYKDTETPSIIPANLTSDLPSVFVNLSSPIAATVRLATNPIRSPVALVNAIRELLIRSAGTNDNATSAADITPRAIAILRIKRLNTLRFSILAQSNSA